MVGFQFQVRGSVGTYVLVPIKPKEDTPAHNKKAESDRSSLSQKKTHLHTTREQRASGALSLSLNYEYYYQVQRRQTCTE